ncbi:hypothetical protein [Streptomyces sp. NPDC047141]|uniref:hypothetical protein n=1 Tax=Streptomyces sp. NPDC047141 TaxID=3155738 RepID=UPI0033D7BEE3
MGVVGPGLAAVALYAPFAMAVEGQNRCSVLSTWRPGAGADAFAIDLPARIGEVTGETGVCDQL